MKIVLSDYMKCSFCEKNIQKGSGIAFVKKDGTIFYFCSAKCKSYFDKGRKKSKYKWVRKEKKGK